MKFWAGLGMILSLLATFVLILCIHDQGPFVVGLGIVVCLALGYSAATLIDQAERD